MDMVRAARISMIYMNIKNILLPEDDRDPIAQIQEELTEAHFTDILLAFKVYYEALTGAEIGLRYNF